MDPATGLVALAATALWALGAWNALLAAQYPFELDAREGTNWLLGLARSSGQDLYDHSRVAFVNMNHGPLDPILKSWIHDLVPGAPGHLANRAFVLALPVAIAVLGVLLLRRRPWLGLLLSGALYCTLLGLGPDALLVGRADPLAMTLLTGQLIAGVVAWRSGNRRAVHAVVIGVLAAATVMASWRFAPVTLAAAAVWLFPAPTWPRARDVLRPALWSTTAAAATLLAVFLVELHGSTTLTYEHFVLFFRPESGWGATATKSLGAVLGDLWGVVPGALVVAVVTTAYASVTALRARSPMLVWLAAAVAALGVTLYGLHRNSSGGGLIYVAPAFALLWFVLVAVLRDDRLAGGRSTVLVLVALLIAVPWRDVYRQGHALSRGMPAAQAAADRLAPLLEHRRVYTEDLHLFERRYTGQTVDMGDEVEVIALFGSYRRTFTATAARAFASLRAHPPEYVYDGGTHSSILRRLLAARYAPVMTTPAATPGTLYRLRPEGGDAGSAGGRRPARSGRPVFRSNGHYLVADAPDEATAEAWCAAAVAGAYRRTVRRGTLFQFLLPNSHGQDYTCPVPP